MKLFKRAEKVTTDIFSGDNHYLVIPRSLLNGLHLAAMPDQMQVLEILARTNFHVRLRNAAGKFVADPNFHYDKANVSTINVRTNHGAANSGSRSGSR